jgi:hypothetical protein
MMSHWIYDRSPVEGLRFEEPLAQLKHELAVSVSTSISMSILLPISFSVVAVPWFCVCGTSSSVL